MMSSVGWGPLHYAAQHNMLALARVLIKGGAEPCSRAKGTYAYAAVPPDEAAHRFDCVFTQLTTTGQHGLDALAIAAERHNVRMARLLVHYGGCDPKQSYTSSELLGFKLRSCWKPADASFIDTTKGASRYCRMRLSDIEDGCSFLHGWRACACA